VALSARQVPAALASPAGLVVVPAGLSVAAARPDGTALVTVEDANLAWERLLAAFAPVLDFPPGVHPRAVVAPGAELGEGVHVGPGAVISRGARLGARVVVQAGAFVGEDVQVGADSTVRANATLLHGTVLGERCLIHPGAVIGSDGFGYRVRPEGGYAKLPHIGRAVLGDDVEVGANSVIDRGTVRDVTVGNGTKIGPTCIVAHNARIGERVVMVGAVQMGGSMTVEDDAVLMGQAGLAGHLTVGRGATVTAQAGVTKDLPPGGTYRGSPARPIRQALRQEARLAELDAAARRLQVLEARLSELEARLAAPDPVTTNQNR
ncbi:MAG TPA: UDP-3-O-(3-hydroxymyristoyl)glucosamine N-acyltransferase, partial [Deinococcales bacterium]|nr:UDP-3-O-(3-hydroxymyristoyl)glucosamine N-acyltransferase [Deinococcales bacterium]